MIVAYPYGDSEKFRAQMFFVLGFALMSPIGQLALEMAKYGLEIENLLARLGLDAVIGFLGYLSFAHSYNIMYLRDKRIAGINING